GINFSNYAQPLDCTGFAYVPNYLDGTVSVIDVNSLTVIATINGLGQGPQSVAFTKEGDTALIASVLNNTVTVVETATHTVVNTFSGTLNNPRGIARHPNSNIFYIGNYSGQTISIMTPSDGEIGSISVAGYSPWGVEISPDGNTLYVSHYFGGVLSIDLGSQMITNLDRKSTRLNSSHVKISYAVFCL